ncbi:carbohydrate ABC transporter permease [Actinoallomurus bryophytorum]|uniref:Multiple sugar transport system permease protein n=1 Tax=Actinoallomurus bryophytorum TaxID=1490222 RepID=A0A543CRQ8_9ACTN|nr:carbohydrate ABC transporter permease [Actinoallomurus bryophytorum]TQL99781.1 multiple sugar transport system permease protein [Actinoallomurus bryophytorum]
MSNVLDRPVRTAPAPAPPRRVRRSRRTEPAQRTLVSPHSLRSRRGRIIYWTVLTFTVLVFTLVFVFPLYWMVTGAMKSSSELVRLPPTIFPKDPHPEVYKKAWSQMDLGRYMFNTFIYALGAWLLQLAVDVSAAFALSKLRPMFGKLVLGGMLLTLMIPPTVLLLPAYLTVRDIPILHLNLLNTPWAIWLPAAANGFNIFLLKRFFDSIPSELLEAAAIDGASAPRMLWSIILPVSRPILGVVSIFAVVNVWKDFVWPLLVMPDTNKMPVSVAISQLSQQMPQNVLIAALVIASLPAIAVFFIFQRNIMAGLTAGGLKG